MYNVDNVIECNLENLVRLLEVKGVDFFIGMKFEIIWEWKDSLV